MVFTPWSAPHWPFQSAQETILLALHASAVWLQNLMKTVSDLNGTLVYLIVIAVLLWTVNKRIGRVLGIVLVMSEGIGDALKDLVHSNRPYFDQGFLVELRHPALTAAEYPLGYSFPSGHSFNLAAFWGTLALFLRQRRWAVIGCIALIFVVGLSRISLAAHWPLDVLGGWTFGTLCVLGVWLVNRRWPNLRFGGTTALLLSVAFIVIAAADYWAAPAGKNASLMLMATNSSQPPFYYVCPTNPPAEMQSLCVRDEAVYISPEGKQPADIPYPWRTIALGFGLLLGAFLEEKYVQFDPQVGRRRVQCLKLAIGLPLMLGTWLLFSPHVLTAAARFPVLPLLQNGITGFVVAFVLPWLFAKVWPESRRSV